MLFRKTARSGRKKTNCWSLVGLSFRTFPSALTAGLVSFSCGVLTSRSSVVLFMIFPITGNSKMGTISKTAIRKPVINQPPVM